MSSISIIGAGTMARTLGTRALARSRPDRVAELDVMHTPTGAKERASSRS